MNEVSAVVETGPGTEITPEATAAARAGESAGVSAGMGRSRGGLSERELGEVLGAFNEVTQKLQSAHETLRAEVVRLQGELRAANEQIERGRRLAALGEMAAGIAHEVRNPLGSIRLYAKMLVDDLADRAPQRQTAEKIGAAVRGLDAVVLDVLAFAREMRVRGGPVEARALLERALEECIAGGGEGERVQVAWSEGEKAGRGRRGRSGGAADGSVWCDADLMHRALVNIIRNSIEAMREPGAEERGSRLTLGWGERAIAAADGRVRRYAAITVRDTGPGVPPGVMERMFNPFFTTRATGTGLGLAIVHRIVDAHGGRVSVRNCADSGEGSGAVVELLLPTGAAMGGGGLEAGDGDGCTAPMVYGPAAAACGTATEASFAGHGGR